MRGCPVPYPVSKNTGSSISGKSSKWDRNAGVLPWYMFGATGMLDFLQEVLKRTHDCVSHHLTLMCFGISSYF